RGRAAAPRSTETDPLSLHDALPICSKRFGEPGLEGAVVVTDAQTGEVQALVGGRDPRYRGFNRALDAARPVGSLLKPAIYLTARSEEHTSELQSRENLVCRLLLEKK